MTKTSFAHGQLRTIAERIGRLDDEIKERNADKSEIYQEAKANGFDPKILKLAIKRKRALDENAASVEETDSMVELYLEAMTGGTPDETTVAHVSGAANGNKTTSSRTRTSEAETHDPETGEIHSPDHDVRTPTPSRHVGGVEAATASPAAPIPAETVQASAGERGHLGPERQTTDAGAVSTAGHSVKSVDVAQPISELPPNLPLPVEAVATAAGDSLTDQRDSTLSVVGEGGPSLAVPDFPAPPQFLKRDKSAPQYEKHQYLGSG
jgi:uncharacterized protein (UPF0335 family)